VFLAALHAQLERDTTLGLFELRAGQPDSMDLIRSLTPRAVIFDLTMAQPDFAIPLLHEQPGLLLIGMDPSRDEMLVLSSRPVQALAVNDLVQLVLEETHRQENSAEGKQNLHSFQERNEANDANETLAGLGNHPL
jgi:hypothetical protein